MVKAGNSFVLPKNADEILKDVSRTLYLSINVMPRDIKGVMGLGYLLCRAADTVVDSPSINEEVKKWALELFSGLDDEKRAKELSDISAKVAPGDANAGEKRLLEKTVEILGLYFGLEEEMRQCVRAMVRSVARGMKMDLEHFAGGGLASFKRSSALEEYCSCIGGGPGVFWGKLYNYHLKNAGKPFLETGDAESIGEALQLTNILKDIAWDLNIGRCYLPEDDLNSVGIAPQQLSRKETFHKIRPVIAKWVVWAVDRLDNSESFLSGVPKSELGMRAAVVWPVFWAMDTLAEVLRENVLDFGNRPKIKRKRIYSTIFASAPLLLSNTSFARGYRFRRETLIVKLNSTGFSSS